MHSVQDSTLVIDTSVLPRRPEPLDIKEFLDAKLHVNWSLVRSIQLHNIKNLVWLGLKSESAAKQIVDQHHLMHYISLGGKEIPIPIPIYVKSRAVDVRIHDLDEEIDNDAVINFLKQYGEVLSIRNEVWKNFFPGYPNGVRVARMVINKPIPSYATFRDQVTLITIKGQNRSRGCGEKSKLRCKDANVSNDNTIKITDEQFPPLPAPAGPSSSKTSKKSKPKNVNKNQSTPEPPPAPVISASDKQQEENNKHTQFKRQLSTEEAVAASKKPNTAKARTDNESGYNAYLDPQVIVNEQWNTNYLDCIADPIERRAVLLEMAERVVALRKEDLNSRKK